MATSVKELQQYFADMDAAEEADAAAAGMTPDELRTSRAEPETAKATRREARFAQDLNERNAIDINAKDVKDLGLFDVGETMIPRSMQPPKTRAGPVPRAAEGFEERAGRQLRYPINTVDLDPVPSLSMSSGVPAKTTDFASLQKLLSPGALKAPEAQPIPVANASTRMDAPAAVVSTIPSAGPQTPAGKPDSAGKDGMPAPSSSGAGGDDELSSLRKQLGLQQMFEALGSAGSGKNLYTDGGVLLDRMKQIEALRAKREEQGITDTRERANNRAQVDYLISRFPDRAEDLQKLYGMTGKPNFSQMLRVEEQVALDKAKKATEEVKPDIALRGADVKEGTLEERITHNRAMEAMARAAAALAAERAARPAAEDRGVRPEALTNRLKDLNAQTKPFQEIVSSLQEADAALSALGTGQISRGAKIASKIPLVGESLVSTPELRAMQGQEGLKQSYQKLKTGLAAVGQELASFERQFGTDWQADPRKAPMAIETLKQITQNALRRTQAPFGAGTGNPAIDQMEVLSLLKNTGGLTADNPIFQPNPKLAAAAGMAPAPATGRPAKPTAAPAGKAVLWSLAEGKWKAVPAENADAAVASGKYER